MPMTATAAIRRSNGLVCGAWTALVGRWRVIVLIVVPLTGRVPSRCGSQAPRNQGPRAPSRLPLVPTRLRLAGGRSARRTDPTVDGDDRTGHVGPGATRHIDD